MTGKLANIKEWLEMFERIFGEKIESFAINGHEYSRDAGLNILNYEFDCMDGTQPPLMIAWMPSRIFYTTGNAETVGLHYVPRNPSAVTPELNGINAFVEAMRADR